MSTTSNDNSIIALDRFIQATRDSGYKGTESAVAELVDNSLQASAKNIRICIWQEKDGSEVETKLSVLDDGCGMDAQTLRQALRFGGSTRFNDRQGLGRYGMGLPNSSLSQARRATVYSWTVATEAFMSYLDVDEVVSGTLIDVPEPKPAAAPTEGNVSTSGTLVLWSKCDRLDNRRISTTTRKLHAGLGRRFREFILEGVVITVNDEVVEALDPLYLHAGAKYNGASQYGNAIEYEIPVNSESGSDRTSIVQVTFSELPVAEWHRLSNQDKRAMGISNGAGVSIVRADREVDYGWFFLGDKRRENYDDWWRCEIRFDPALDDAFGITHTKQQIRPKAFLLEALAPDLEATARALNGRVRKAYQSVKVAEQHGDAERQASLWDHLLSPLPVTQRARDTKVIKSLMSTGSQVAGNGNGRGDADVICRIVENSIPDTAFFTHARHEGRLLMVLNPDHPFYRQVYKPLMDSDLPRDRALRTQLELLLIAAARSEASVDDARSIAVLEKQRMDWSNALAAYLKN